MRTEQVSAVNAVFLERQTWLTGHECPDNVRKAEEEEEEEDQSLADLSSDPDKIWCPQMLTQRTLDTCP